MPATQQGFGLSMSSSVVSTGSPRLASRFSPSLRWPTHAFLDRFTTKGAAPLPQDWRRNLRPRHIAAAALAATAAVLALDHGGEVTVVVTARPVASGKILTSADVTERNVPANIAPQNSPSTLTAVIGRRSAGPMAKGEILSPAAFVSPERRDPARRLVPITLANPRLNNLLITGDVVDVLAVTADGTAEIVASAAVVFQQADKSARRQEGGLLIDVDTETAKRVALMGADTIFTVTIDR